MKCELCQYQEKPDNLPKLATHLETCPAENSTKATVVWRDSQITATMNPLENDMKFDVVIRDLPDPEVPPVVVPKTYEPNVQMMSLETIKRSKNWDTPND